MRFEVTHHDVHAARLEFVRLGQHLKGLADTGGISEKDLQSAFHSRP